MVAVDVAQRGGPTLNEQLAKMVAMVNRSIDRAWRIIDHGGYRVIELESAELSIALTVELSGGIGIEFQLIEAGIDVTKGNEHTLTLTLKPAAPADDKVFASGDIEDDLAIGIVNINAAVKDALEQGGRFGDGGGTITLQFAVKTEGAFKAIIVKGSESRTATHALTIAFTYRAPTATRVS